VKENLVTVAEVSEQLSLSSATVYRMLSDGRLKGVRMGRSIRVHPESVRECVDNNAMTDESDTEQE